MRDIGQTCLQADEKPAIRAGLPGEFEPPGVKPGRQVCLQHAETVDGVLQHDHRSVKRVCCISESEGFKLSDVRLWRGDVGIACWSPIDLGLGCVAND